MGACWALAKIGRAAAPRDSSLSVRAYAANALARRDDLRAVDTLVAAMDDPSRDVQRRTLLALADLGKPALFVLVDALDRDESDLRREAIKKLGELGDVRAIEPLFGVMREGGWLAGEAAEALAGFGPLVFDPAVQALRHREPRTRSTAARLLGRLGDPRALDPLCGLLRDESHEVQRAAANALGTIGDARAVGPLAAVLGDRDSWARDEAAGALAAIDDPAAVEPLLTALADDDARVRRAALRSLQAAPDARIVDRLIALLDEYDPDVRRDAADALARTGDVRAIGPLVRNIPRDVPDEHDRGRSLFLGHPGRSWNIAAETPATDALCRFGPASLEPLVAALGSADPAVRLHAAFALGEIGDRRAVEPLRRRLEDEDYWVRDEAHRAPRKFGVSPPAAW